MGILDAPVSDWRKLPLGVFKPERDLPLIASYDASVLTGANNSALSLWPDSSINQQDLSQPTGSLQPTVITNGLNGKRIVRLGADDYVYNLSFGNQFEQGNTGYIQPVTISAVIKVSSAGSRAASGAVTGWVSPASTNRLSLQVDTSGAPALIGNTGNGAVGGEPINDDQWHIVIGVFDIVSSSLYVDGYLVGAINTQAHGNGVIRGFGIGDAANATTTVPLGLADIAQIDVINGRMPRLLVNQYTQSLATKWGLS